MTTEREFLEILFPIEKRDVTTDQLLEFRIAAEGKPAHQKLFDQSLLSHVKRKLEADD